MVNKKTKSIILVYCLLFASLSVLFNSGLVFTVSADYSPSKVLRITIDHDYIDTDLVNFPLLVVINSTVGAECDDGDSISFNNTGNTTMFKHEIEKFDDTSNSYVWVNVTAISSTVDTDIWMRYNDSDGDSQEDRNGTWDTKYEAVYHMGDYEDSTSNDMDLAVSGAPSGGAPTLVTDGMAGDCYDFEWSDDPKDFLKLPEDSDILASESTYFIMSWLKPESNTENHLPSIYLCDYPTGHALFQVCHPVDDYYNTYVKDATATSITTGVASIGTWSFVASYDEGSLAEMIVWQLDDYSYTSGTHRTVRSGQDDGYIGYMYKSGAPVRTMDGYIDECRISSEGKNASYINATYHTINQSTGFLTWSEVEQAGWTNSNPTTNLDSPSNGAVRFSLQPTCQIDANDVDASNQSINVTWQFYDTDHWYNFGYNQSDNNMSNIQQTLTNASAYGTTYQWRVVVKDNATPPGYATNITWSFTTVFDYTNLGFWFFSSIHLGANTWEPEIYPADLEDMFRLATNDTRDNVSYHIHLARGVGDLINWGDTGEWVNYYAIEDIIEGFADESINTTGNHDSPPPSSWDDESGNNKASVRTFGNVVIYNLNADALSSRDYDYDGQMEWLNTSLQANTSNICILSLEAPLLNSFRDADGDFPFYNATPRDDFEWMLNNTNVEMYITADLHKNVELYNVINATGYGTDYGGRDATLMVYMGSIQQHDWTDWDTATNSLYVLFEHGSNQVQLRWRNHSKNGASWVTTTDDGGTYDDDGSVDGFFTWNLSKRFDSGTEAPYVHSVSPSNGSTDISLTPTASVNASDFEGDSLTVTWATNESESWVNKHTNTSVIANTTASYQFTDFDTYATEYWWRVYVNDGTTNISETYHLSTTDNAPDTPSGLSAVADSKIQITITWTDGTGADSTRIEQHTSADATWDPGEHNFVYNGSAETTTNSSLSCGTSYWYKAWSYNTTYNLWSLPAWDNDTTTSACPTWYSATFGGNATVEAGSVDVRTDPATWTGGIVNCGDNIRNNFTFYQDGGATIEIKIGFNATNYTFVNYTTWSSDGGDQYCANFTINAWSSESMIEPKVGENPVTILKDSLSGSSSFLFGVRIWVPKGLTSPAELEDFEIMLVATDIS